MSWLGSYQVFALQFRRETSRPGGAETKGTVRLRPGFDATRRVRRRAN